MSKKGIYSKRCWIEGQFQNATVFFQNGIITEIKKGVPREWNEIYNAGNSVVMPGAIDTHVHVNEPGRTEWEGFNTATKAAAAGGVTSIVDMPLNASPVTTTLNALKKKISSAKGKLHVNCAYYGGLVPGNENEIEELCSHGVLGIKAFLTHSGIDEFPNVGEKELHVAMPILAKLNYPLLVHCELADEAHHSDLDRNPGSYQSYLTSRPKEWENKAIALMIDLCRKYSCRTHIVHVSSSEALVMIKKAKEEGLPLTAETCPHYIYFNAEDIPDGNTLYKCAPPIREKPNNELLKEALVNGVLDFIASDHSPAPPEIKEKATGNLQKAWGGIAGLQFLLPASWTALKKLMPLEKFIPLLTEHPAQFLKISYHKGLLKIGYDADITVWSPEENFLVKEEDIFHRHKISPYVGKQLWGKVHQTYVSGELIFNNGQINPNSNTHGF
jgi:allantoinase